MNTKYLDLALSVRKHVKGVQDALYSIEESLGQRDKNSNDYVNIFRAELIRRALIHDSDKCGNVNSVNGKKVPYRFAEYTVGHDHFVAEGGPTKEYSSGEYSEIANKAHEGLTAWDDHRKENDHHPEYYKDCKKDMKLLQLMEMVCDWWGKAVETHDDPNCRIRKFEKDSDCNVCKYGFTSYQKFVIELTREFLVTRGTDNPDTRLIEFIFKLCANYGNDFRPLCSSLISDIDTQRQFFIEMSDFLKGRKALIRIASARGTLC